MKPEFEQIEVECWECKERLGKARPQICLYHEASVQGREIWLALGEMATDGPESKRTLTFEPSRRKGGISTLRLRLVLPRPELQVINISRQEAVAAIEVTPVGLNVVREAIQRWCDGSEDFCVSPQHAGLKKSELGALDKSSGELWFRGPTMEP